MTTTETTMCLEGGRLRLGWVWVWVWGWAGPFGLLFGLLVKIINGVVLAFIEPDTLAAATAGRWVT